ncbi:MAG: hypothetical protein KDA96_00855 [Planctomycetaceae bacterium]|nr:hypothetical protein [Planctomycetaceae bacterium]
MSDPLLRNSHGTRPRMILDDTFAEGIAAIAYADEARTLLLATRNGELLQVNEAGALLHRATGFHALDHLVLSATGTYGAAAVGMNRLVCFDHQLRFVWDAEAPSRITAVAIAPYGSHLAFSTESARTHIVSIDRKETARIETKRSLDHLEFLTDEPHLIGVADFGQIASFGLYGEELWNERIMNNVGDLSVSGSGRRILVAAFNHGVQVFSRTGKHKGAFMLDGIPFKVSGSAAGTRLAVLTQEHRLYWLDYEGNVKWVADMTSDPPLHIRTGPLGDRLFVVTVSGRVILLEW